MTAAPAVTPLPPVALARRVIGPELAPRRDWLPSDVWDALQGKCNGMLIRVAGLFCWAFLVWTLLTWTLTVEQQVFGAVVALAVAVALAPLGDVAGPWRLLRPRALAGGVWLLLAAAGRVFLANLRLSRRIWDPRRPLSSGMVIVPTRERSDWGIAAVGVISSLIVDNQITDLDPSAQELQYHAIAVPDGDAEQVRKQVNGPVEDLLKPFGTQRRAAR